ncbi:XrtY-associated glycosyltransferase XYAG1 [Pedobacter flavus]|uniref:Glycosyltransferase n=1 Tax=Pedobacter flavus TaxID=3113906 RepID=A0ABU7GY78_9SPHI|nr:glycosyltransferase [Pedobacter sp. VNH31]MEE1883930.1 glycosyltransferase [Pedobacter sp. VNH31]
MKIIHINASYKPAWVYGGPTMSVAKLCESLALKNIEIEVLTTLANGENELYFTPKKSQEIDGVRVTYFKRLTKDHSHFSPSLYLSLYQKIKKEKKTIVHIHAWWNLISIFSCLIALMMKASVIVSPRGMITKYSQNNRHKFIKSLFHNLLGKFLLQRCYVHVTSELEKQDILEIVVPKSIHIISNIVELPLTKDLEKITNNSKLNVKNPYKILFLSRIEEKKGLELLFEALAKFKENWSLSIAGSGTNIYIDSLVQLSINLNIDSKINWIGQISNDQKFKVLANHNLLALTSYNENFANVVIESLSVGTPVLISNKTGLYSYVRDKNLGWVCELNSNHILSQLQNSFNDFEKRQRIKNTAPEIISNDYNSSRLTNYYLAMYNTIINDRI